MPKWPVMLLFSINSLDAVFKDPSHISPLFPHPCVIQAVLAVQSAYNVTHQMDTFKGSKVCIVILEAPWPGSM